MKLNISKTLAIQYLTDILSRKKYGRIIFYSLIISPILFMVIFGSIKTYLDLTYSSYARRQALARLAASVLNEKLERLVDIGLSLSTRVKFTEYLNEGKWDQAIRILANAPQIFPTVERIFIADTHGILQADTPGIPGARGKDFSYRDWYKGVSRDWKPYVSETYKRAVLPKLNVIAVAIPVLDSHSKPRAILVLQVRLDSLVTWTREIDTGPSTRITFIDHKGHIAANPDISPQGEILDISVFPWLKTALRGASGVKLFHNPLTQDEQLIAFEPVPKFGWVVSIEQSARLAFATRNQSMIRLLLVYSGILILTGILAHYLLQIILQLKASVEKTRKLNVELENANREMEAFSYSVSHDLRSPLHRLIGFSQILLDEHAEHLQTEALDHLVKIRTTAQKMIETVDSLLQLSQLSSAKIMPVTVDLSGIARAILMELQQSEPQRRVSATVAEGALTTGDEGLLRVLLDNLLRNAWKFTSKKDLSLIDFGFQQQNGQLVFYVKDNGIGFDMRNAKKLFSAFQRLHSSSEFPGTGIGLAIVQRIITRHGGRVWAESKPGEGAVFYFTLPQDHNLASNSCSRGENE